MKKDIEKITETLETLISWLAQSPIGVIRVDEAEKLFKMLPKKTKTKKKI